MSHRDRYREHRPVPSIDRRKLGERPMDERHVREAARAAFRKRDVIVFLPDDLARMPEYLRRLIESEAVRLYGEKR